MGTFWRLWGFTVNGILDYSPRGCKPAEKTVHHPSWVISEALPRVYFALPACLEPKYTLWRASEMTPDGWCTVFSAGIASSGRPVWHTVSPEIPKSPKSAQNRGTPFLTTFSGSCRQPRTPCRRFSPKNAKIPPPVGHPKRGISALFGLNRRQGNPPQIRVTP